ncbi:hypothetical protein PUN49_04965 [Pseudomonas extremaustralis]|jgi:hypothetical protein|nr:MULTISPECIES: hypothetical protein [Pseudomonas]MBF4555426.1 hypothetical protein [Pseudomonas sp. p50(2008)]MCQ9185774.1 hypothetical protein [Streptomyces hayashii]MDG2966382.1 hypothetical protein [Pseudomonas extremaustralis]
MFKLFVADSHTLLGNLIIRSENLMFETYPSPQQNMHLLSVGDDTLVWKIVMHSDATRWFYLTQIFFEPESGEPLHSRMIMISDLHEFLAFANAPWRNSSIGSVYLISPMGGDTPTNDWDFDLLTGVTEFSRDEDGEARYVFDTRWGKGYSVEPDGIWDQKQDGRIVYTSLRKMSPKDYSLEAIKLACEKFKGDLKSALLWLLAPQPALGGKSPCEITEQRILKELGGQRL